MPDNWKRGILLDTETSGTDPKLHQVLTVDAIAIAREGHQFAGFETFHAQVEIQPWAQLDSMALSINKIDPRTWTGDSEATVVAKLIHWVRQVSGDGYQMVYGYNAGFDVDFLKAMFHRARQRWTDAFSYRTLDVMQLAMWARVQGRLALPDGNVRLGSVAGELGIDASGAHDSAADCKITLDVMNCLLADGAQGSLFS